MPDTDNITLEKLIRDVDYKALEDGYIPSQFAIEMVNFIKLVNGAQGEEHNSPLFHYKMLDNIQKYMYNLIVSFRGSAKSSLLSEYLILYLAVFGKLPGFGEVNVGLVVCDSMDNGIKNLRNNIEHRFENSDFLKKYITKTRFTDSRLEFTNAEGKQLCIRGFGVLTGVRGFKEYGERPSLGILDDLFSQKAAESDTVTRDIEDTIYKAVMPALHPTRRKIIWVGTPMSKRDPLYKAAGTSAWNTLTFPICHKFPCDRKEFVPAWEDRFPYESVKAQYDLYKHTGRIDAFNQELMLRILSDDDRLILDEDIIWYPRNDVLYKTKDYNFYMTTDFATSEKESADFSVIAVWALDYTGRFHWVDGVVARQNMAKNVDDVFRLYEMYKPLSVGVEVSGQQKGFVSWLQRDMTSRGIWFHLASDKSTGEPGLRPTTSKLVRFNAAVPLFKQRKVAFPEELRESAIVLEYIDELTSVTPSGAKSLHDDCLDSVSQLQMLEYFNPHNPNKKEEAVQEDTFTVSPYFINRTTKEEGSPYLV
jgi:predicted phage terminase large subunit-like protein